MRRVLALALLLSLALAAPAAESANKPTKVKFSAFVIHTNGGKSTVARGKPFVHCPGVHPTKLTAVGQMHHPSKKGVVYSTKWTVSEYHLHVGGSAGEQTRNKGKLKTSVEAGGGPMSDGTWVVHALRNGKPVGKASLALKSDPAACG